MKIFLVRHGETDYGTKGLTTGHCDIPLNETGEQEAQSVANFLEGRGIVRIFSSSLSRASSTANIIAADLNLPFEESDDLREHTSGKLDGVPLKEFFATLKSTGDFEKMVIEAGGEPTSEFKERVWNKFLQITEENSSKGNILLVTHGGVIRTIFAQIVDAKNPTHIPLSQGNCCVNIVDYDEGRPGFFLVNLINYTDHIV